MSRSSDIVSQIQRRRAERKKPKVNSKLLRVKIDEGQMSEIAAAGENKPPPITLQKTGGRNSFSLFFSIGLHVSLALLLGFIYIKERISADEEYIPVALVPQEPTMEERNPFTPRKRPTFEAEQQEIEAPIETTVRTDTNILNPRNEGFVLPSTHNTDLAPETPGLNEGPRINVNPRNVIGPVQPTKTPIPSFEGPSKNPTPAPDLTDLKPQVGSPNLKVPEIDTSPGNTAPTITKRVEPTYPQKAKRAEKEGTVKLQATIGTDGIPKNIVALTKPGFGFEDAAIAALKKWRFIPGKKKGKNAEMTVSIDIQFKLDD